jgi:hypothetical protein
MSIWGSRNILLFHQYTEQDENEWGFGQVVAVVLFLSPLINILEFVHNRLVSEPTDTVTERNKQPNLMNVHQEAPANSVPQDVSVVNPATRPTVPSTVGQRPQADTIAAWLDSSTSKLDGFLDEGESSKTFFLGLYYNLSWFNSSLVQIMLTMVAMSVMYLLDTFPIQALTTAESLWKTAAWICFFVLLHPLGAMFLSADRFGHGHPSLRALKFEMLLCGLVFVVALIMLVVFFVLKGCLPSQFFIITIGVVMVTCQFSLILPVGLSWWCDLIRGATSVLPAFWFIVFYFSSASATSIDLSIVRFAVGVAAASLVGVYILITFIVGVCRYRIRIRVWEERELSRGSQLSSSQQNQP